MDNEKVFKALYDVYFDRAMRTAKGILGDEYLAADAVQDAFMRVYRNWEQYDDSKPFGPWFNKILINKCKRIGSKRNKIVYIDKYKENVLIDKGYDEKLVQTTELEEVLENLEDKIKVPIILKYIQGLKIDEIAEIMNLNVNTVKPRLLFGRNKLKALYSKWYKEVK